jgi:hypothetical protein
MIRQALLPGLLAAALVAGCAGLLGVTTLTAGDGGPEAEGGPLDADGGPDVADATSDEASCSTAWIDGAAGSVPPGAINSEPQGEAGIAIYVCRTPSGSDVVPGKLLPGWGCYFSDGSTEVLAQAGYQVLVAADCTVAWQASPGGIVPAGAFPCGQDSQGILYSCRVEQPAAYIGELGHMGWGTSHQCIYDYGNQSLSTAAFDVLTIR